MAKSMALPKGISVSDMVKSAKRGNDGIGIEGYEFIKYNPHMYKSTVFTIPKDNGKPRDYISLLQNDKKKIPGPS